MRTCPKCGYSGISEGAKFCGECGAPLAQEEPVIFVAPVVEQAPAVEQAPTASFFDPSPAAQEFASAADQNFATATSVPVATAGVKPPTPGKAIAALVLGIAAVVFCWVPGLGIILGILGIIFGALSRKLVKTGQGLAGIITGAVGIVGGIITIIACTFFMAAMSEVDWDEIDFDDLDGIEVLLDDDDYYGPDTDIDFTWDSMA